MKPSQYYIVSLKHTSGHVIMLWRPNNSGYTIYLDQAGKYSQEDIATHPQYYNDGKDTLAIPCKKLDKLAKLCIPWDGRMAALISKEIK